MSETPDNGKTPMQETAAPRTEGDVQGARVPVRSSESPNPPTKTEDRVKFGVLGVPVPQGSARAFVVKGRPVITSASGKPLKTWRQDIAFTARTVGPVEPWTGPVAVTLRFKLPMPKSEPRFAGRGKAKHPVVTFPDRRPDLDKLVRAVLDALTGPIFRDDSQVVELTAFKNWGDPGVWIEVSRILV